MSGPERIITTSYWVGFNRGWAAGFATAAVVAIVTVFVYFAWLTWGPK